MWPREDEKMSVYFYISILLWIIAADRPYTLLWSLNCSYFVYYRVGNQQEKQGETERYEYERDGRGERQAKVPLLHTRPREVHTFSLCQSANKEITAQGVLLFLLFLRKKCSEEARIAFTAGLQTILQEALTSILFTPKDKIKGGNISNTVIPLP